jgi:hypothetical protein
LVVVTISLDADAENQFAADALASGAILDIVKEGSPAMA